jgi:hypothetical protein
VKKRQCSYKTIEHGSVANRRYLLVTLAISVLSSNPKDNSNIQLRSAPSIHPLFLLPYPRRRRNHARSSAVNIRGQLCQETYDPLAASVHFYLSIRHAYPSPLPANQMQLQPRQGLGGQSRLGKSASRADITPIDHAWSPGNPRSEIIIHPDRLWCLLRPSPSSSQASSELSFLTLTIAFTSLRTIFSGAISGHFYPIL